MLTNINANAVGKVSIDKQTIIQNLKRYLESKDFSDVLDTNTSLLLEKEKDDLKRYQTNWQSYVLSFLPRSGIFDNDTFFIRHWMVKDFKPSEDTRKFFCEDSTWNGKNISCSEKCWNKTETEFDAVIKDKNGNWLAVFEYEDDYNSCCQELCNMIKLAEWLKPQQKFMPIFCLFYWLPSKPPERYSLSKQSLDKYVDYITNYMNRNYALDFLLILQTGPDEPPYKIDKTIVVDSSSFSSLQSIINSEILQHQ